MKVPASRSSGVCLAAALLFGVIVFTFFSGRGNPEPRWAGVARVDVTPDFPVMMTGYAGRSGPSAGVAQRLWAKALAIGGAEDAPALWLTLDNCGVTHEFWLQLRERIMRRTGVAADRIVLTISHTHSAPATTGWAPFIQPENLSGEAAAAIDRYTTLLMDRLESVAVEALAHPFPATLSWSEGRAGFAANRRTPGGPVDHALPVLKVEDAAGNLKVLLASYACHCTTLGAINQMAGDWAGCAQEALEREHPGAVAMIAIGCGADSNPAPRGGPDEGLAFARQHGEALAAEVQHMLTLPFRPLKGNLASRAVSTPLPFIRPFTPGELEQRAKQTDIVGRHARHWQDRLRAGERPPAQLPYDVTAWSFDRELALLFLPGEVVVDYSLRLKQEFDAARIWINAYSNWVPCYIPSRRILTEGGYEAESSLWYYNRPQRLAPESEDRIIRAAHEALPDAFEVR